MNSDALVLTDRESVADLGRYAARARSVDADGAMRVLAVHDVLAAWVGVLPGHGLMGDGTVLGLRTFALASAADVDVCLPLGAVTDRTSRTDLGTRFPLPPTRAFPPWSALTPPRTGWEFMGALGAEQLVNAAREGIAEIAQGSGAGAGALAVADLRARVWARELPGGLGVRAGAGFAAYALGFLTDGGTSTVHRSGPWTRVSSAGGHVLLR